MRINILEAGLVTFLMAGKGFLPKGDAEPVTGAEADRGPTLVRRVRVKPALKGAGAAHIVVD